MGSPVESVSVVGEHHGCMEMGWKRRLKGEAGKSWRDQGLRHEVESPGNGGEVGGGGS